MRQNRAMPHASQADAARESINTAWNAAVFLVAVCCFLLLDAGDAYALPPGRCAMSETNTVTFSTGAGFNPICDLFSLVSEIMSGLTGKTLATLAIMAVGAAALFGKVSWPMALITALGVGLLFGAGSLLAPQGHVIGFQSSPDPISNVCNVIKDAVTSAGGRAVGVVACCILGIGALFGRISWMQGLMWAAGIGMVFGANELVKLLWDPNPADLGALTAAAWGLSLIPDPIATPFMTLIGFFMSGTGIAVATVGVMALGFAALLGKISWVRAMLLGVGIALMYGAADVMFILSGPMRPCRFTSSDTFTQVICGFMEEIQGPVGKTVGTLAVIVLGILSMLGKVSWELAFVVAIGIALIFGANAILDLFEASNLYVPTLVCNSPVPAAPDTGNALADVLCYILQILWGPAGKALAMVAIIMMGFGALMGKVSFSQAFIVATGIAVMFGAQTIVNNLLPDAITTCTPSFGSLSAIAGC